MIKMRTLVFLMAVFSSCSGNVAEQVEDMVKSMSSASAELGTVEYTVSKIIKANDNAFYKFGDRKILFTSRSTMKAGVDISAFCADSVVVNSRDNSITIKLPNAKILAFNMPAENIKMEYSKVGAFRSEFTAQERNDLLKQAEEAIINDAENLGILKDAEDNAKLFFEAMLMSAGYSKVHVEFAKK